MLLVSLVKRGLLLVHIRHTDETFTKAEYLLVNNETDEIQREKMLPVIAECYSIYQEGMFKANRLD